MCNNSAKSAGFTLVELIITIAIAGILVTIAIPSFNSTISSNRLTNSANDFVGALNLARSEAVKRGIQVTVRNNGAATHWERGWNVFVDVNGDENYNPPDTLCRTNANGSPIEDCLLRTYPALPTGYTLTTGNSTYKNYAAYLPSGFSTVVVGDTFTLCSDSVQRTITINSTGRPSVATATGTCP